MGTHPIFESDFDCLTDMTELKPYSDKFSELVEEYKNIDSCWKTYSNRLIELAGDLNNFDEQVETIVESCKSGSVLSDLFPDLQSNLIAKIHIQREAVALKFREVVDEFEKIVSTFELMSTEVESNLFLLSIGDIEQKNTKFSDFEIFSYLKVFYIIVLKLLCELKHYILNNDYKNLPKALHTNLVPPLLVNE